MPATCSPRPWARRSSTAATDIAGARDAGISSLDFARGSIGKARFKVRTVSAETADAVTAGAGGAGEGSGVDGRSARARAVGFEGATGAAAVGGEGAWAFGEDPTWCKVN